MLSIADRLAFWRRPPSKPVLLDFRSSSAFVTFVVSLAIFVEMACLGLVAPTVPFHLQDLGYTEVASLTGWLIAGYGIGLCAGSIPIGFIGEVIPSRRFPLLLSLFVFCGTLVMLMLVKTFALMMVARVLQGLAGAAVWSLGLALICDTVPGERAGYFLGFVMIGFSTGALIGPLAGGLLYAAFGWYSLFYFTLALAALDIVARWAVIERREAIAFRALYPDQAVEAHRTAEGSKVEAGNADVEAIDGEKGGSQAVPEERRKPAPIGESLKACGRLFKNPRALTSFLAVGINGLLLGSLLDTGLTLLVNQRYGLKSRGAALVYIAAVVPSFIGGPLSGHIADKRGAKGIGAFAVLLALPPLCCLIIEDSLPGFVVNLAVFGAAYSLWASPVMQDLSEIVLASPALGYAHVYGIFNACYAFGALVGPLIAGQTLESLGIQKGWTVMVCLNVGLSAALIPLWLLYVGDSDRGMTRAKLW